jgi:hypothetical protein
MYCPDCDLPAFSGFPNGGPDIYMCPNGHWHRGSEFRNFLSGEDYGDEDLNCTTDHMSFYAKIISRSCTCITQPPERFREEIEAYYKENPL